GGTIPAGFATMLKSGSISREKGINCRAALFLLGIGIIRSAWGDQAIYSDSLQNGWLDWGWATINYNNTSPVHGGSKSVSVTIANTSYQAIYIAHNAFDSSSYASLKFWIHGGSSGGQQLQVWGHAGGSLQSSQDLPALPANSWQQVTVSLATLGVANRADVDGFYVQDRVGAVQPTFYLDDIALVAGTNPPPPVTNTLVAIQIDPQQNRHPIDPR